MTPSTNGQTTASQEVVKPSFPKGLKIPASIISIVFHPFLMPVIGTWLIVYLHFYEFAGFDKKDFIQLYGTILTNTVILPFATVFLLSKLKFISNIGMPKNRDRIIPYIALMTFYFWAFLVFKKQPMAPDSIKGFMLGIFIASILGFLSNLKLRTSLHMIGMGCLIGILLFFSNNTYSMIPLMAVILASGLVATSRIIKGGHSSSEIYLGLLFGIVSQLLAFWIV